MSDPQRWLDDETSSSFERELLGAGALSPPRDMESRVWSVLTVGTGAAHGAGTISGGGVGPAANASIATATKMKVILSALAAIGLGGAVVTTGIATERGDSAVHVASQPLPRRAHAKALSLADRRARENPPVESPTKETITEETPESKKARQPRAARASLPTPTPAPTSSASTDVPSIVDREASPAPSSDLREQALRLREVRDALARRDLARAEALLAAAERSASLAEERDALVVQTASARGDRLRARSLGEAFLVKYPSSPLHARITKIVARSKSE